MDTNTSTSNTVTCTEHINRKVFREGAAYVWYICPDCGKNFIVKKIAGVAE